MLHAVDHLCSRLFLVAFQTVRGKQYLSPHSILHSTHVSIYTPSSIHQLALSLLIEMCRYQGPPRHQAKPLSVHTSITIPSLRLEPPRTLHSFVPRCCFSSSYVFQNTNFLPSRFSKRTTFQTSRAARYRAMQGLELPITETAATDGTRTL